MINEIKDSPEYAENRPLIRALRQLDLHNHEDCLEFLDDYDGILANRHKIRLQKEFIKMQKLNDELNDAENNE